MTSAWPERAILVAAALAGLAGVALSALAAHLTGGGSLDVAARFLLAHAPVLLAVPALATGGLIHRRVGLAAAAALVAGLVLFCGDLSVRALTGVAPIPLAAPTGGILLMAGWAALAAAALLRRRRA